MQIQTLYVIGNGFDLHHKLATGFTDFKKFLGSPQSDLQSTVEDYLCDLSGNWANLEEALAYFDVDQLIDHASNFLVSYAADDWSDSYHHDYQFEINEVVRVLSSELKKEFYAWLQHIEMPHPESCPDLLKIEPGAFFLNFNYTPTIQQLYSVNETQILHIHGSLADGEEGIVLGHGWKAKDRSRLNEGQDPEEIDTRVMQGNDLIDRYFEDTFKPTDALITRNQNFFGALGEVANVYVWGHSLSDVDLSYFAEIDKSTRSVCPTWHVSHYSSSSISINAAAMAKVGVHASNVRHHKLFEYVV